jgi:hypothetical protein
LGFVHCGCAGALQARVGHLCGHLQPVVRGREPDGLVLPAGLRRAAALPVELSHAYCGAPVHVTVRCADEHVVVLEQLVISPAAAGASS